MEGGEEGDVERVFFRVEGRVQGVGFRWWTSREACVMGLRGYVRNLEDGSVEVGVEGRPGVLARLEDRLGEGPPGAGVRGVSRLEEGQAGDREAGFPERGFEIRG
jgi:acylphosphatase